MNGKSKSSSTKKFLGTHIDTYIRWVEYQITAKMIWSKFEIDHLRPTSSFDVYNNGGTKEAFCWKNIQRSVNQDNNQKGTKFNFVDYRLQFIQAYQFIRLNEARLNEDIHR